MMSIRLWDGRTPMVLRPEISDWARAVLDVSVLPYLSHASTHSVGATTVTVQRGPSVDPLLTHALFSTMTSCPGPWTVHAHTDLTDDLWAASPITYGDIDGRGAVINGESGDIAVSWNASQGVLTIMDRSARAIVHTSAGPLPTTELGGPLRTPLHWITAEERQVFLHAGTVEVAGRAILIIGPSGAGKSSLTIQALRAGLRVLGDDYVFLGAAGGTAEVSAAYRTVKAAPSQLCGAPVAECIDLGNGKVAGFLRDEVQVSLAPLGACVMVDPAAPPLLQAVSPAVAVRTLAASTVMQAPLYSGHVLSTVARAIGCVPCFRLGWVDDLAAARQALEQSVVGA